MPQTYVDLEYHVIFSTHEQRPFIASGIRQRLYDYIGGILKNERCVLLAAGGTEDHVHLLISTHTQMAIADLMRAVKAKSSKWIHENFPNKADFQWQAGYGAFSVSRSNREIVMKYIDSQKEHHRKISFKEELASILKKCGVQFDPKYL